MSKKYFPITDILDTIIDNRGRSVPTSETGFPLIATNCIKHSSIYPTFENIRFVSSETLNTWFRAQLNPNDILFVNKGTPGRTCLVPNPVTFCAAQDMIAFRVNPRKVYYKYLFAVLRSNEIQKKIKNFHVGLVIPHFKKQDLSNLLIPLIQLEKQIKIGDLYLLLSYKIELNNRINTELEAMAKTLYDYWFVQFDFPDANGKPYKSSGGKMVYNKDLKREIPEGWEVGKIADWIASDKSGDWGKEQEEGNYTLKVSCIRGADINGLNGKGELNPPERYILEKNSSKLLNPYDLIIEISGGSPTQSTGRMAYITQETLNRFENPLICSNFCKAISLKNEKYLYNFASLWNMLYDNNVFFGYEGKTSGIKNFLFDSFVNSYWSVIPQEDIILQFYTLMQDIEKKKQKLLAENQQLASLRDWLLPMLMNGQVGFKEAYQEQTESVNVAAEAKAEYGKTYSMSQAAILGGYLILKNRNQDFGRTKLMKLLFLTEYHCQLNVDKRIEQHYYKNTAGPYNDKFIDEIEKILSRFGFYTIQKEKLSLNKDLVKYISHNKELELQQLFQGNFSAKRTEIDAFINLLKAQSMKMCEIIATLYAVWNNRIIRNEIINDSLLIQDFYDWSEHKHDYTKSQVSAGLNFMRNNHIIPAGFGDYVDKK